MFKRSSRFQRPAKKKISLISRGFLVKLGVFAFFLLILAGGWWFFRVVKTTYTLKLEELPCTNETVVKNWLEKENIKFYWFYSQEIGKKIKQQFPCINEANVERKFPFGILVSLSGRKPVAVFRVIQKFTPSPLPLEELEATGSTQEAKPVPSPSPQVTVSYGETFLVDNKGVGFVKGSRDNLPLIDFVAAKFAIGDGIGADKIDRTLKILQFFQAQGIVLASIEMEGDKLSVKSEGEIVFSLAEGIDRQGASLQLIWKQAKMNSKSVVKIDLRFDKPVVTYAPDKK